MTKKNRRKHSRNKQESKRNKESYGAPRFTFIFVSSRDHVKYLKFLWFVVRQSDV